MKESDSPINGNLLRLQREARGLTLNDIAHRACLSLKQVQQLEEGGLESFYSEAVKVTAAKKVASLLGLSAAQALNQPIPYAPTSDEPPAILRPMGTHADGDSDVDRNADEKLDGYAPSVASGSPKSSRTSLWVMVGLFVAALALAAWMNPRTELVTSEPEPPPLQTLPAEAPEPASSRAVVASEPTEPASR
jgi:cytoskeletal protein RodZ